MSLFFGIIFIRGIEWSFVFQSSAVVDWADLKCRFDDDIRTSSQTASWRYKNRDLHSISPTVKDVSWYRYSLLWSRLLPIAVIRGIKWSFVFQSSAVVDWADLKWRFDDDIRTSSQTASWRYKNRDLHSISPTVKDVSWYRYSLPIADVQADQKLAICKTETRRVGKSQTT